MWAAKLFALATMVRGDCVIEQAGYKFDFASVAAKQFSYKEDPYTYQFTFCQASPQPCGFPAATSLCQVDVKFQYSLGLWEEFHSWAASPDGQTLTGTLDGEYCSGGSKINELNGSAIKAEYRQTKVTFQCGDGPTAILSVTETALCEYEMIIRVPRAVCKYEASCCAPPTYTSTRMEIGGAKSVVQRDGSTGDWFDGNYQGRGSRLLCSASYNRCFTYNPSLTTCTGSAYRAAPIQCFASPDWNLVTQSPLSDVTPLVESVWVSTLDASYVVTMPFGDAKCVAVSGSDIATSFGFSLTPDASLWKVPQICLKEVSKQKF